MVSVFLFLFFFYPYELDWLATLYWQKLLMLDITDKLLFPAEIIEAGFDYRASGFVKPSR